MVVRQDGLLVLQPEQLQVLLASRTWQDFETGDVLEQGQHHPVELSPVEPLAELRQCNRHESAHFVVAE